MIMMKGQKKKSSHVIAATLCFSFKRCGISHILNNNIMILLNSKNFNITSQHSYNSLLKSFDICSTACPHCGCRSFIFYGTYPRSVRCENGIIKLHIHRVLCTHCHKTHALFPTSLVPHKSIPLFIQCEIVDTEVSIKLHS